MKPGEVVYDQTVDGRHIVIRYPTIKDVLIMANYINDLSAEETYVGKQGEQITYEVEEKYLITILDRIQKREVVGLLMLADDYLVGLGDIHSYTMGAMKHSGGLGLSLSPHIRGKGWGTLLLRLLLDETKAKMTHLKMVKLDAFAENEAGMRLYKKFGFKEYGRLPGGFMRKGRPHTHVAMYKEL